MISREELQDELIEKYRDLVAARYDYDNLEAQFILDESVTPELTEKVKTYFLSYIYPSKEKRRILNKAFADLDKHIKNPTHLLKLLGDAPGILLKFGWQFPKAIKAGMQTLKSFKTASKFEEDLFETALAHEVSLPISDEEFEAIIADLDEDELREFIEEFEDLLTSLTDTKLLEKTTEILNDLIRKMEKQSDFFSQEEVAAMKIGNDILYNGYHLFDNMSSAEKKEMIRLIMQAENHFIDELLEKYED